MAAVTRYAGAGRDAKGRFRNPEPMPEQRARDFFRWQLGLGDPAGAEPRRSGPRRRGTPAPRQEADVEGLRRHAHGASATWLGHSTFLLQLDGQSLLTDPMLGPYASPVPGIVPRLQPAPLSPRDLPPLSALLASHNHYDHLDAGTVRKIPRDTPVLCPLGMQRWFEKRGFKRVTELDWWESAALDTGMKVTLTPAQHFSARGPRDRNRTLWGGFVVEVDDATVYYAGDSGYFGGFRRIGERFPGVDVAILPIGAYEPRWFMRSVHVNPEEAGQAFLDVGARTFIPCHWGTFRLTEEPLDEPPERIRKWWAQQKLEPGRLRIPKVGETLPIPQRASTA